MEALNVDMVLPEAPYALDVSLERDAGEVRARLTCDGAIVATACLSVRDGRRIVWEPFTPQNLGDHAMALRLFDRAVRDLYGALRAAAPTQAAVSRTLPLFPAADALCRRCLGPGHSEAQCLADGTIGATLARHERRGVDGQG